MLTTYETVAICIIAPASLAMFVTYAIDIYYANRIEDEDDYYW